MLLPAIENIVKDIDDYFNNMTPLSRVNYSDVLYVFTKKLNFSDKKEIKFLDSMIHFVVRSRPDLMVQRGRGIVKMEPK